MFFLPYQPLADNGTLLVPDVQVPLLVILMPGQSKAGLLSVSNGYLLVAFCPWQLVPEHIVMTKEELTELLAR